MAATLPGPPLPLSMWVEVLASYIVALVVAGLVWAICDVHALVSSLRSAPRP